MNITLCSAFRNAEKYLKRYFNMVGHLDNYLNDRGHTLWCVWGEGDSTDGTYKALTKHAGGLPFIVYNVDCSHGGPVFGSVESAERFKQLAGVGNLILQHVPLDTDAVVWVESDLTWQPEMLIALIDRLQYLPCVAPMIMEKSTGGFYDTWAFRCNGQHFTKHYPYHTDLHDDLLQMDSVGSCVAMLGDIAKRVRFPEEDVFVGLCRQINALGESVWLDPALTVWHP